MALIIGLALALLGIAVAVYPFVRHRLLQLPHEVAVGVVEGTDSETRTSPADDLESVYEAIRTLQLERELGNVPEGLFREQLNSYRIQAATLLRALEKGQESGGDWALEEEIKIARTGLRPNSSSGMVCANCGKLVPTGVDACPECGVAASGQPENRRSPTVN
ncbi:MAG: hypothetical protein OXE17_04060 [Chloroflexi bacterium]|nr:hypothetical protein [Chloroflexota bacterium]